MEKNYTPKLRPYVTWTRSLQNLGKKSSVYEVARLRNFFHLTYLGYILFCVQTAILIMKNLKLNLASKIGLIFTQKYF